MFHVREDQLAWNVVGSWTAKDYDFGYEVYLGKGDFPLLETTRDLYRHEYIVKGRELLCYVRQSDANEHADFDFIRIFSLDELSVITEISMRQRTPPFLPWLEQVTFLGEIFYSRDSATSLARQAVFTLRYPPKNDSPGWERAISFSRRLKMRICERAEAVPMDGKYSEMPDLDARLLVQEGRSKVMKIAE